MTAVFVPARITYNVPPSTSRASPAHTGSVLKVRFLSAHIPWKKSFVSTTFCEDFRGIYLQKHTESFHGTYTL